MSLPLLEVSPQPPHPEAEPAGLHGEAFSLLLGDQKPRQMEGGTYRVAHPEAGTFLLFVSPVGTARNGQRYQVVVDRRRVPSVP